MCVSLYGSSRESSPIIVPADKAPNNVVFICKTYYYSCLQNEFIDNNDVDSSTNFTKEEILVNHRSVLTMAVGTGGAGGGGGNCPPPNILPTQKI